MVDDAIRILIFMDICSDNRSIENFFFCLTISFVSFLAAIKILQSNLTLEDIRQKEAQLRKEVHNMVAFEVCF